MFTSGSWKKSSSGEESDVINPATGEVIASVPKANLDDVNACIQSSREAFQSKEWASMDPAQRGRILQKMANATYALSLIHI